MSQASVTVAGGTAGNATLTFDGNFVSDVFTITSNTIRRQTALLYAKRVEPRSSAARTRITKD